MALTCVQSKSIDAAEKYFSESLAIGDYYLGEEIRGTLHGSGAYILGLEQGSFIDKASFGQLLRGRHPETGQQLAQRVRQDRRPCLDMTFSPPKSISLLYAVNEDRAILDVLAEAVQETMQFDVEPLACRRVRDGKHAWSQHQKTTGNLIYSRFLHRTARPVNGTVDPQLHFHCIVFNHTSDDGKHYALEPEQIFRQRYSLQSKFEARLARKLKYQLGYEVEHRSLTVGGKQKHSWEVQGISREVIEKFSRRTEQIEAHAAEHGITDPKAKEKLSIETRDRKEVIEDFAVLRQEWRSRLSEKELAAFERLRNRSVGERVGEDERQLAIDAVRYALEHHLYRESTCEKHTLVGTAAEHGLFLTPEQIEAALDQGDILQASHEERGTLRHLVTTRAVYEAEQRMIEFAREGRGTSARIANREHKFSRDWLNDQQQEAVLHVLNSRDVVTAITGGAGTGKTSTIEEIADGVKQNNKKLFVFAPTTGAREVLSEKGFEGAETVEHLIRNERLQAELQEQVMLIDEAALMDVRSMNALFEIAKQQNARVILSGDVRQHSSPRRGEAYRILQEQAGLNVARIEKIQRQRGQYRRAVEMVSLGNEVIDPRTGLTGIVAGFDMLDKLGKVIEIEGDQRHEIMAAKYLKHLRKQSAPLLVAPSHAEGDALTKCIRDQLSEAGALGKAAEFSIMRSLNLSEAQKGELSTYEPQGMVVEFHQNVTGFKRGARYLVCQDRSGTPMLKPLRGGATQAIPVEHADRFEVYERDQIEFAVGDKIRFSLGGKAVDGKRRISNGRLDEIAGFDRQGNIRLKSGLKVSKDYGHFTHGMVITSHASQGKDSPISMAAIGSQSLPAVNAKQFYVTVSRGKEDVRIYVDDKDAVRRAIQQAGEQLSATEMLQGQAAAVKRHRVEQSRYRQFVMERARDWWHRTFRRGGTSLRPEVVRHPQSNQEPHPAPGIGRS